MIIVAVAVLVTGAMLLSGGTALALQSPKGKRAGIVMGVCGGVLMLLAGVAMLLFYGAIVLS